MKSDIPGGDINKWLTKTDKKGGNSLYKLMHTYKRVSNANWEYKGRNLEESLEKLKTYYKIYGLNPGELDKENFQKWMCDYCRYKDMCKEMEKEGKVEMGKARKEVEM